MLIPPIFDLCNADAPVKALLENAGILRVFPFAFVQKKGFNVEKPYLVWQTTSGTLENKLEGGGPCADNVDTQIDIYGETVDENRAVVNAIENALNNDCVITTVAREELENETQLYRSTFSATWILKRI
jgi:hypothetical protein